MAWQHMAHTGAAHVTIGEEADERVRLREEIPAIDASDKTVVLLL